MQSATVAENLRKSPLSGEVNGTAVPYLTVYRHTGKEAAIPDGASRYLYYIADGSVRLHTPSGILDYVSGQYSLSAVDMPFRGEIVAPSVHGDFLALSVGFTADEVFGVLMSIEGNLAEKIADGKLTRAFSERADGNVTDCIARLTALLQCQKRLRLSEARRLLLNGGGNVTDAAFEVGYGSVSQFIRDYKKMFGSSPKDDIKNLRSKFAGTGNN